jgi:hypothetical protein
LSDMEQSSKTSEGLWTRCPRLGGEAPFTYCLQEAGDLPCHRIIVCWKAFFPVEAYLRKTLSPQKWEEFADRKPKEKITSLLEMIEEAKSKVDEE